MPQKSQQGSTQSTDHPQAVYAAGLAFVPIGESGEVKCFAACEISDGLATVKVLKKTGTAWAITTVEV